MKFHLKMTLCMLAVLAALFGAGGSLLISESFEDSLEREKTAALGDYRMAWGTLQIVNSMDAYLDREAIIKTMEQLYQQNSASWSDLRLSAGDEILYESGGTQVPVLQIAWAIDDPEPGNCLFRILDNGAGAHFLVFSGAVETNGDILYLTTSHDVSALYTARQAQQHTYLQVFFLMCVLCAALSYTVSRLLTAPLGGLSQASRAIAAGNFSSRVRIRSNDEIGAVSADFNAMAEQMEQTVSKLNQAVAELHQAMERQEQFTGSFAHEMKTPMTSLIGYAELLRSGSLTPEEQAEAADYLYSEGKRLESLSHKLLELLVLKKRDIPFAEISPAELIEALVERLRPLYAAKDIHLSCRCERGVCLLEADLVWSLLLNLADNAQKAMEHGGEIQLRLKMLADGCQICVLDDGRGIPPQALKHLTEAFYRVDKARSRAQGGFGLGLSLCREIAGLHRGSIRFENRPEGRRRQNAFLRRCFLPATALCLLLAVCIVGFKPDASAQGDKTPAAENTSYRANVLPQTEPNFSLLEPEPITDDQQQPGSVPPVASGSPQAAAPDKDSWNLILVNPWNSLPADYTLSLTELKNGLSVDSRCYPDLQAMMDACRADGLSPVICSAYRTQEYQEKLFQNKVSRLIDQGYSEADATVEAGKSVAVPGTSEHQLGLAVDIVDINNQHLDESQESTAVQKWLMEHCWEYGFILRYPNDKSEITGIIYEPWHYRYVGREDAEQIHSLGVCLEEYLEGAS